MADADLGPQEAGDHPGRGKTVEETKETDHPFLENNYCLEEFFV